MSKVQSPKSKAAWRLMERIEALGRVSEEKGRLTRTYGSPAMKEANELVGGWMREAGMAVSGDAVGNLVGRYAGSHAAAKTLILGSHLDTVRDAGKFDGPLGVLTAIACVQRLHDAGRRLPFALEVIGFADEEGVRFQTTYLGSKALAGKLEGADLKRVDARGVSLAEAIRAFGGDPANLKSARRNPRELLGYAEVHIEQGPVLEQRNQPVGIVTAIAGQSRVRARFIGRAGHAGTTPLNLRRDALAAAAVFILSVEDAMRGQPGLVATVGQLEARPGASNVIPGEVILSVDIRHARDGARIAACARLREELGRIGNHRDIAVEWEVVHEVKSVPCAKELTTILTQAAGRHVSEVIKLPSGAGHDAAVMASLAPVAMLFVRCAGGVSHHPDEAVKAADARVAIAVLDDFLLLLAEQQQAQRSKD